MYISFHTTSADMLKETGAAPIARNPSCTLLPHTIKRLFIAAAVHLQRRTREARCWRVAGEPARHMCHAKCCCSRLPAVAAAGATAAAHRRCSRHDLTQCRPRQGAWSLSSNSGPRRAALPLALAGCWQTLLPAAPAAAGCTAMGRLATASLPAPAHCLRHASTCGSAASGCPAR